MKSTKKFKHLKTQRVCESDTNVKGGIEMPFLPLKLDTPQICFVASKPEAGRTLYALHLIQDNSLKYSKAKSLAYFISNKRHQTIKESGFGVLMNNNGNVNFTIVGRGQGDMFIEDIRNDLVENDLEGFNVDYIVIDGFEDILIGMDLEETDLLNISSRILKELSNISTEFSIPIIITTSLLLNSTPNKENTVPLHFDINATTLEVLTKHTLRLYNPFYSSEGRSGEFEFMEVYLSDDIPLVFSVKPISIEPGRYKLQRES